MAIRQAIEKARMNSRLRMLSCPFSGKSNELKKTVPERISHFPCFLSVFGGGYDIFLLWVKIMRTGYVTE